jgi:hypothetical protein
MKAGENLGFLLSGTLSVQVDLYCAADRPSVHTAPSVYKVSRRIDLRISTTVRMSGPLQRSVHMANFVVNAQPQGACDPDYVIHDLSAGCNQMRSYVAWIKLGEFSSCDEALVAASRRFPGVVACDYCCSVPAGSINKSLRTP